jgi:hypothetical protein
VTPAAAGTWTAELATMSVIRKMLGPPAQPRFERLQIEVAGLCNVAGAYFALTCASRTD